MTRIFGFAAASVLALASAPAAAEFELDQRLIENFDGTDVGEVLTQLDAAWTLETDDDDGSTYYDIEFSGGYFSYASTAACEDDAAHTGCMGLLVYAPFDRPEGVSDAALKDRINQFNSDHSPTKGVVEDDGSATLILYVMTDYGITRSNLYLQLAVFEDMIASFDTALAGEVSAD